MDPARAHDRLSQTLRQQGLADLESWLWSSLSSDAYSALSVKQIVVRKRSQTRCDCLARTRSVESLHGHAIDVGANRSCAETSVGNPDRNASLARALLRRGSLR